MCQHICTDNAIKKVSAYEELFRLYKVASEYLQALTKTSSSRCRWTPTDEKF